MPELPNIIWIQTDEQRPDSLGCYGSEWAKTPNIDDLARRGTVFSRAFCQSPACVPSRTSQLCCVYPQECNCLSNKVANHPGIFPQGVLTFPEVFQRAGYETASFGKWHTPQHPTWMHNEQIGIDRRYSGFYALNEAYDEDEYHVIKRPGGTSVILAGTYPVSDGNPSQVQTDKAIEFLKNRDAGKPFLLRVSHNWPHTPVLPPPPFDQLYDPDEIPIQYYDEAACKSRSQHDQRRAEMQRVFELSRDQIRQERNSRSTRWTATCLTLKPILWKRRTFGKTRHTARLLNLSFNRLNSGSTPLTKQN